MKSNCLNCKKDFSYFSTQSEGKYCNNKCQAEYTFLNVTVGRVENGEVKQTPTLRRYLIHKRGNKCEICGISEWNNAPLTLPVDHINGDSDDNTPKNIRLLCPNCHYQTPTFSCRKKKNSYRSKYRSGYREMVALPGIEPGSTN